MRIGIVPENPIERLAMAAGVVPTTILEGLLGPLSVRLLIVAVKLGIFEKLRDHALTTDEVATRCGTGTRGTQALLNALLGMRYLSYDGERYALTNAARRWFLSTSQKSLTGVMGMIDLQWGWSEQVEEFILTDRPVNIHAAMNESEWSQYQQGMRSLAGFQAQEIAMRIPANKRMRTMLDVGGAHGYYSVEICRRFKGLKATVFDLPDAVRASAPILVKEGMGDRVKHREGDALKDDFGTAEWDLIFISDLVHHFDDPTNRALVRKCAKALRPEGVLVLKDAIRTEARFGDQIGGLGALACGLLSDSNMWTRDEMADWQEHAGLRAKRATRLLTVPGVIMQSAVKPS